MVDDSNVVGVTVIPSRGDGVRPALTVASAELTLAQAAAESRLVELAAAASVTADKTLTNIFKIGRKVY